MRYRDAHEVLVTRLPELAEPYRRLFEDWDNFEGEPPGQYVVFSDTLGTLLEIALELPPEAAGRRALLGRLLAFGEEMLASDDAEVVSLGIDAVTERLDVHPEGPTLARELGGTHVQSWFKSHGATDWQRPGFDEIIDLWGVRLAAALLFPDTAPRDIPGISYPAVAERWPGLAEAQRDEEGVVLLSAYGTSHPVFAIRAERVRASETDLEALAEQLAEDIGNAEPPAKPALHYLRVPVGERVWNLHTESQRHARLFDELWIDSNLPARRHRLIKRRLL